MPEIRRRIFLWFVALTSVGATAIAWGHYHGAAAPPTPSRSIGAKLNDKIITSIPFEKTNDNRDYNASGVVQLADSRFLFCDNNSNDALYELDLTEDGLKKGPLIKRPLQGIAPDAIDDLEAITLAEEKGRRFVFVTSSLFVKKPKEGQSLRIAPSGLLRVTINPDDSLSAENMPGFRDWFIQNAPAIAASAKLTPDDGGLNVEGLAWDQERQALLFGVRTPLSGANPLVIPVRVKKLDDSWTTDNLKMLPPIRLSLGASDGGKGIRSIEYVASRGAFLIVVGKTVSGEKTPFELYEWKGGKRGKLRRLDVSFAEKMKPEGVTGATIGGRPAILFVDDNGGYQVLWLDKL